MTNLNDLEQKSIFIIREAFNKMKNPALLWSIGKDSTTLLWLIRKAFYGKVPFPVMHIDTTYKFPQMYEFRDKLGEEYGLNLLVEKNEDAIANGIGYETHDAFTCCHELKTNALKKAVDKHNFDGLFVGIRRDEHGIRNKERFFSPRDNDFKWNVVREKTVDEKEKEIKSGKQGDSNLVAQQDVELDGFGIYATEFGERSSHVRIHPLLHWREIDIWRYIEQENIPICDLYLAKDGKRYRSLGCMPITEPVDSDADNIPKIIAELEVTNIPERSGRKQDKESAHTMQKLRSLGYM